MRSNVLAVVRACIAVSTASLAIAGVAAAQVGAGSAAGGPSNGYAGTDVKPPPSRGNTPTTGGGPTTLPDKSSGQGDQAAVSGRVEKLDRANHTLRLSGVDRDLSVGPNIVVLKNGDETTLDSIREGDEVRASLSPDDQVTQIDVRTPPRPASSGPRMRDTRGPHEPPHGALPPSPASSR